LQQSGFDSHPVKPKKKDPKETTLNELRLAIIKKVQKSIQRKIGRQIFSYRIALISKK